MGGDEVIGKDGRGYGWMDLGVKVVAYAFERNIYVKEGRRVEVPHKPSSQTQPPLAILRSYAMVIRKIKL